MPTTTLILNEKKHATGILPIDTQHHELVSLANRVLTLIKQGVIDGILQKLIDELLGFALIHSDSEERVLSEHGYADLEIHIQEHLELISRLATFKKFSLGPMNNDTQTFKTEVLSALLSDAIESHLIHAKVHLKGFQM